MFNKSRDQIANIHWIIEKAREFKKMYFCYIDYAKAFDSVDHNNQTTLPVPWETCMQDKKQ